MNAVIRTNLLKRPNAAKPPNATKSAEEAKPAAAKARPTLSQIEQRFIELWGDMSSWWGVNRTMAEMHGLLYITGQALAADEIQERLAISRGNVSMNIRTLVEWGLVRRVRKRGERKDYFESLTDVWEMFTVLAAQRKRREIDPIIKGLSEAKATLGEAAADRSPEAADAADRFERVDSLLGFLLLIEKLGEQFFLNTPGLRTALELLAKA